MKKRILSMLLVLCMVISVLPMTAFAEDVQVQFRLNNVEGEGKAASIVETITPSDTILYYTTNENKEFVAWTGATAPTANDKYIKVSYPVAEEAVLYVTLNNIDAVSNNTNYGDQYHAIYFGEGAYAVVLTLQGENSIETGTNAGIHTCAYKGTTITGSGSLTINSVAAPGCITARRGNLLIKDTTLDFTNTSTSWRHAILLDGFDGVSDLGPNNLTIDGATITANIKSGGFVFFAKYNASSGHGAANTDTVGTTRTLHIKDSTITAVTATGGSVFRTNTAPVIEYSNITASCSVSSQRLFRVTPVLIGMKMVGSQWEDGRNPETYDETNYGKYRYIKTTAEVKVQFRLNNAAGEGKAASIVETIAPSDTPLYYTTNANKEFVAWTGAEAPTANDKYIKIFYPAATEAVLYVTLNNIDVAHNSASFDAQYNAIHFSEGAYAVNLTLQGENSIATGTNAGIFTAARNGTTITGEGSLTLSSTNAPGCITVRRGNLLIEDTTLDFTNTSGSWRHAILLDGFDSTVTTDLGPNNLTVDGATITANINTGGLFFFGNLKGGAQGAGVTDTASTRTLYIKDSTINAETKTGGSVIRTNTAPVIEYSNIIMSSYHSSQRLFKTAPVLIGMEMIGSQYADGSNPEPYDAENYGKYRYIKTTASTTGKPFYTVNWSGEFASEFDYVYDMPFFYSPGNKKEDVLDVSWNGARTIPTLAQALKEEFNARPDGTRYFNFAALANAMRPNHELYLYHEKIMGLTKAWMEEFLAEYKRIGGKLDGIILDIEFVGARAWELSTRVSEDPSYYEKVVQHPMYATTLRPLLEERGFKFWPNSTKPEIYGIDSNSGSAYAQCRQIWDVVLRNRLSIYLNDAVTTPLLKYYPDAVVSDYQTNNYYGWQKRVDDNGAVITGGNYLTVGNASNFNSYGFRPTNNFFMSGSTPRYAKLPAFNEAEFKRTSFNQTMYDIKFYKDLYVSDPNNRINTWIGAFNYSSVTYGYSYCKTPYYSELLYHVGMLDPQPFLGYITKQIASDRNTDYDYILEVIDDIMGELTRVAGFSDRKPILIPTSWNDSFLLSGMYAGGRNIWRLTPDLTNGMTLDQFKVEGTTDPTFVIDGQTITFPGGKIIEDAQVREVGTCGYWIETAKDVMPQVTNALNRYQEYPAFAETYEAYENGVDYTASAAQPTATWEVITGTGGTATIQTVSGNKVLAMMGTKTLKNVNMPKNITAGDTYAKVQTWEVTVTVPASMAANAEIVALNVFSSSTVAAEGGFKIAGGKVYYANEGNYVVLSGVDVSTGGTFTFKRELDFTQANAFKSNYSVYDSAGKLLAEARNIPMKTVTIPVQRIGLKVTNVTGNPVLFDNYKLYASGIATDFELYDAKTGIKETDVNKARTTDTAYRLSWMNATSTEKVYAVVAAYYNGNSLASEKVVKEIRMVPGTDGVDYNIVKNEEGKTLKVYLKEIQEHTHTGGTATCTAKAVCSVCEQPYGEVNPANHAGGTRIEGATTGNCGEAGYTGDTYCEGCDAKIATGTDISATGNHTGGTATCTAKAVCSVCEQPYGEVNPDNHTGGTRTEGAITGNCGVAGYTGDTYCEGCDAKIATGTDISATGNHTGGIATCTAKAVCTVCEQPYGEVDSTNHDFTEFVEVVPPTLEQSGYTVYKCVRCDATEQRDPTNAQTVPTVELNGLKATVIDIDNMVTQTGVKVMPLNSGIAANDLTGWKSFTDLAGTALNGRSGYTNLGTAKTVELADNGDYVFYVTYKGADGKSKLAFYVITVNNLGAIAPDFGVAGSTATLSNNGFEVIQSGVKFVGKDSNVDVSTLTGWSSFVNLTGTALNGRAGYTNLAQGTTAELNVNGDYVFYIIYKDAKGGTKTVFVKKTANADTPDFNIVGGTAILNNNGLEVIQSGVKHVGMDSNVDVNTLTGWSSFTNLSGTALNGRAGYTNLAKGTTVALTAEGDYVFYIIYKDVEQVTRTIYLLKTV